MKRHVIVKEVEYTLTYDEYNTLDTVMVKGTDTPLSTKNKVVQKLVNNSDKILHYLPVNGVKYI